MLCDSAIKPNIRYVLLKYAFSLHEWKKLLLFHINNVTILATAFNFILSTFRTVGQIQINVKFILCVNIIY